MELENHLDTLSISPCNRHRLETATQVALAIHSQKPLTLQALRLEQQAKA